MKKAIEIRIDDCIYYMNNLLTVLEINKQDDKGCWFICVCDKIRYYLCVNSDQEFEYIVPNQLKLNLNN